MRSIRRPGLPADRSISPPKELLGARPSRPQKSRRDSGAPVSSLRIGSTIGGLDAERAAHYPGLQSLAALGSCALGCSAPRFQRGPEPAAPLPFYLLQLLNPDLTQDLMGLEDISRHQSPQDCKQALSPGNCGGAKRYVPNLPLAWRVSATFFMPRDSRVLRLGQPLAASHPSNS